MKELQYICDMCRLLIFSLLLATFTVAQQAPPPDLKLLKKGFGSEEKPPSPPSPNSRKVMNSRKGTPAAAYNPIMLLLKGSMLAYQHVISPQLSAGCLYQMTCSNYAKHAIGQFGAVRGVLLTADRLTRCNRGTVRQLPPFRFTPNGKAIDEPRIHFDQ